MKKFNFNLEKILKLREHNENEAKIMLGRSLSILHELENKLMLLAKELSRAGEEQFSSGNNVNIMQQYMFYLLRLENSKEILLEECANAELEVEKARNIYIEASRERKVLDKLKEKRIKEYKKEVQREENLLLDDTYRHTANRNY